MAMGKRAEHLADRARRPEHAFPNASMVDRGARQVESRLLQPREVSGKQLTSLLALGTLCGEMGR